MERRTAKRKLRPFYRKWTFWIPAFVVVLFLAAGSAVAANIVPKVLEAKMQLEAAIPLAARVQQQLLAGDQAGTETSTADLKRATKAAREQSAGRVWRALEGVPIAGPNLRAVRVISETVDDLVDDAVIPASTISADALKPTGGRIDVEAVGAVGPLVDSTLVALGDAELRLRAVDREAVVDQIDTSIVKLDESLAKAKSALSALKEPLAAMPGILGADGPRRYLMIFQGNSEARASGGNPAAMVVLSVDNGSISITQQESSSSFQNDRDESVIPLDPETEAIYSNSVGKWIPNITSTPHFPTTVELMKGYWAEEFGTHLDGIVSFDPVALSYLLRSTGPVALVTGDTLTSENAVPLLLHDAYIRFPVGAQSDVFFAAAASSVFEALMSGGGETKSTVAALVQAADEGRLKMWSGDPDEAKLIASSHLDGALPESNAMSTVLGVYFNDTTGSKMDYYVDAAVNAKTDQCLVSDGKKATYTADVTLRNSVTREEAATLPKYVTGPYYQPGFIATDFLVYGPVGGSIDSWLVNGKPQPAVVQGSHLGRAVVRINYVLAPGESVTVSYKMSKTIDKENGPVEVLTSPMVRPTPVSIESPGCEGSRSSAN